MNRQSDILIVDHQQLGHHRQLPFLQLRYPMDRVQVLHQKSRLVFWTSMRCNLNPVELYSVFFGGHQMMKMMLLQQKQRLEEKILRGYCWPNGEVLVPPPVQSESHRRGY
jgi:hypothetical protein